MREAMDRRHLVVVPVVMLAGVFVAATAAFNLARVLVGVDAVQDWLADPFGRVAAAAVLYALYLLSAGAAAFAVGLSSRRRGPSREPGLRQHLRDCALLYASLLGVVVAWLLWPHLWRGAVIDWTVFVVGGVAGDAAGIRRARKTQVARAV
jgi:hypothetical protein